VWATDLWISAAENAKRIRAAGLSDKVVPLHADARSLPFAAGFFDAIIAVDSYPYYGTDDLYLNYLVNFVKEGGQIGVAGAALTQEMTSPVPEHLAPIWGQDFWCLHSAGWWRRLWERTGLVEIEAAEPMTDGWKVWIAWHSQAHPDNKAEIEALRADAGSFLGYTRIIGRRQERVELADYAWPDNLKSFPEHYEELPMLKSG
ncbi:MAG: SAM-dependent methyltransferase, partial [Planctomycetota bacterium]